MNTTLLLSLVAPLSVLGFAQQAVVDKPIAPYQTQLLDVAFKAASAFPEKPHKKSRTRNQEAVVEACFELGQPARALGWIEKISGWRRGKGYADYAVWCARNGAASQVQRYSDLAEEVAKQVKDDPDSQDWHIDRIRVTIAQAHLWLGQQKDAARDQVAPEVFDEHLETLEYVQSIGNFDQTKSALDLCAELYGRFYDETERRERVEAAVRKSGEKLPPQIRIEFLECLAETALEHQDRSKALSLVHDARAILDATPWNPEDQVALESRIAALRFRAGDARKAKSEVEAAHERFQTSHEQINSIFRGVALRPLAEAYETLGERAASLAMYRQAMEEAVVNPNSRPRADDLCALCCSMAVHGVEPDAELQKRIESVCAGLGEPW